jgi:hypothetical protein
MFCFSGEVQENNAPRPGFRLVLTMTSLQVDADSNFDWLTELGFSTLHSFEEVNCDAATWTMVPGP